MCLYFQTILNISIVVFSLLLDSERPGCPTAKELAIRRDSMSSIEN